MPREEKMNLGRKDRERPPGAAAGDWALYRVCFGAELEGGLGRDPFT